MKTKIKKMGFLLLTLVILLSGGIFIEVEEVNAFKCLVVNPLGGPCDIVQVTQLGCRWGDAPGSSCTSGQYACTGGFSVGVSNISVCLINDLHPRKCDTGSACFTDGSPAIAPPPVATLGAYQYCSENDCTPSGSPADKTLCRVTSKRTNWADTYTNGYPAFNEYNEGVWDNSESQCVVCSGVKESEILGDSGKTYVAWDGAGYSSTEAGNGFFESACEADASCDEQVAGVACSPPVGGSCNTKGKCVAAAVVTHTECSGLDCLVVAGAGADECGVANPCTCTCLDENPDCCGGPGCLPAGDVDCSCNALGGILCSAGIACTGAVIPNHSDAGVCCNGVCTEKWACSFGNAVQCCAGCTDIISCTTLNGDECAPGKKWTNCDVACAVNSICGDADDANSMPDACGCSCDSVAPVCGDASDGICPLGCTSALDADCPVAGPGCDPLGGACVAGSCCAPNICTAGVCVAPAGPGPGPGPVPVVACDPDAWFFCNPLRGNVETLAEGGERIIGYILGLIGSIALLLIIISGAMYMTSAGSEERIANSKKILTAAVIGLGIALLAYSLLAVIMKVLGM